MDTTSTHSFATEVIPPTISLLLTAAFSVVVGVYLEKFKNRLIVLKYTVQFSPLATSIQDNYWGNIQVTHNGRLTKYLNFVTIDIINDSNNDVPKDIYLDIWVNAQVQILGFTANYNDIGNAIPLEANYLARYNKAGERLTAEEKNKESNPDYIIPDDLYTEVGWVQKNKKFHLPIFNRKSSAKINLLIESFDGNEPTVSISILQTSVKLVKQADAQIEKKRRDKQVNIYQIVIYVVCMFFIFWHYPESKVAIWFTIGASFVCYVFARWLYLFSKFLKRMFW